jgi:hypothetical protein
MEHYGTCKKETMIVAKVMITLIVLGIILALLFHDDDGDYDPYTGY